MKSRFHFVVFILSITVLFLSACQGSDGAFGPIFPTPTQIGVVNRPPVPVNFETLDSDPFVFVDRFVRVTGRYIPPRKVICGRQRGPSIDWFLISDELEMNMSGFGSIVGIAPEQAFFTVDGIWRRYRGPVGCAKEPQDQTIWYLEVVRIVDPNPLVASTGPLTNVTIIPANNVSPDPETQTTTDPNNGSVTIEPTSQTVIPSPTATLNSNSTPPPTTPTPTVFVVATSTTPTPTATVTVQNGNRTTATPTPTAGASAQPTISPTPTVTPTTDEGGLGGTGSGTPNASTPVPTPNGGYPAPDASPTTNPYP